MENPPLVITLSADDIQPSDFTSFIETHHQLTINATVRTKEKEGRSALGLFTDLVFSDSMAGNLFANVIYVNIQHHCHTFTYKNGLLPGGESPFLIT